MSTSKRELTERLLAILATVLFIFFALKSCALERKIADYEGRFQSIDNNVNLIKESVSYKLAPQEIKDIIEKIKEATPTMVEFPKIKK